MIVDYIPDPVLQYPRLTLSFLLGALTIYYFIIYPLYLHPLSHVPGPIGCKFTRLYLAYYDVLLQRNDKVAEWHRRYGPVICIGANEVSFSDVDLMKEIYGSRTQYVKSSFFDHFMAYGERALFSIGPYGEHHEKRIHINNFYSQTQICQPVVEGFIRERIATLLPVLDAKLVNGKKTSVNMYPLFNCFSFDNITRLLYGPRHCAYTVENNQSAREILLAMKQAQIWAPIHFNFPSIHGSWPLRKLLGDGYVSSLSAERNLAEWNHGKITAAIADPDWVHDHTVLRKMRTVRTKLTNEPLSFNYIAAELYDHLNAAQETVAVALVYVHFHLANNPIWQDRIRQEILSLPHEPLGEHSAETAPTFNVLLDKAVLLEAFIREVHRVNPGASGRQERYVPRGGKAYNGIHLPEGVRASASTIAIHHNPTVYPSPNEFRPERWLEYREDPTQNQGDTQEEREGKAGMRRVMNSSFMPFGYGVRSCLGKAFATLELKLLTAALVERYTMRVDWTRMGERDMWQTGTMDSVPCGLRCELVMERI